MKTKRLSSILCSLSENLSEMAALPFRFLTPFPRSPSRRLWIAPAKRFENTRALLPQRAKSGSVQGFARPSTRFSHHSASAGSIFNGSSVKLNLQWSLRPSLRGFFLPISPSSKQNRTESTKLFLFLFILFTFLAPLRAETSGYLAAAYTKGQAQAETSRGSFQNPLLGLIFSGDVTAKIDYITEVRLCGENRVELDQILLRLKPSDAFHLELGLYLVPFGRYNPLNRPHQTLLIHDPLPVEKFSPSHWRDVGVLLEGKISNFFYSAYLGNGLAESERLSRGQQFQDNNSDKGKGGRMGIALSRWAEVAYSFYRGKCDESNERDLTLQGVDVIWATESIYVLSEYSKARIENPEDFLKGEAEGYFVQVSFNMGNLHPVVCYQKIKYNDPFHGQGFSGPDSPGEGISEQKNRWALGFGYFFSENALLKFEYDINREKDLELKNNSYSVQVALSF